LQTAQVLSSPIQKVGSDFLTSIDSFSIHFFRFIPSAPPFLTKHRINTIQLLATNRQILIAGIWQTINELHQTDSINQTNFRNLIFKVGTAADIEADFVLACEPS